MTAVRSATSSISALDAAVEGEFPPIFFLDLREEEVPEGMEGRGSGSVAQDVSAMFQKVLSRSPRESSLDVFVSNFLVACGLLMFPDSTQIRR